MQNAHEYGFYSNVNPNVDHPRWSQKTERRLGGGFFAARIPTQMFNGYGDQVASLYNGMDLEEILLNETSDDGPKFLNSILTSKWTKVVVFLLCLVPFGILALARISQRPER